MSEQQINDGYELHYQLHKLAAVAHAGCAVINQCSEGDTINDEVESSLLVLDHLRAGLQTLSSDIELVSTSMHRQDRDNIMDRLYRLAAIAHAGGALLRQRLDLVEVSDGIQSAMFVMDGLREDFQRLAADLESFEIESDRESCHA